MRCLGFIFSIAFILLNESACAVRITAISTMSSRTAALMATPILTSTWSPSSFDFGDIDSGPTGEQVFTLTNNGSSPLEGCNSPTVSNSSDFEIVSETCGTASLAPSSTCSVTIRANPSSLGVKRSSLLRQCASGRVTTTAQALTTKGIPIVDPFGSCSPNGTGLTSGLTSITEDYNAGGAAAYNPATNACWRSFHSSLNPLLSSDYGASFVSDSFNGVSSNMRRLTITGRPGVESNTGVNYTPFSTPATGWNSGQFPYSIEMYRNPNCYAEVTMTAKIKPNSPGYAALQGLIVNGTVTGTGYGRRMTGYFIHGNGGGNSLNLAMYKNAYDRAFDFVDLSPTYNGHPNPQSDGPAKAWDYLPNGGSFPAGGGIHGDAENIYAAHYKYNFSTHSTLIEWEVRGPDGVDHSPGVWDYSRTLTGSDSIPPAGGYGVYMTYYGGVLGPSATNAVQVGGVDLQCLNP